MKSSKILCFMITYSRTYRGRPMDYNQPESSPFLRLLAALGVLSVAISLLFFANRLDVSFFTFVLTPIALINILGQDSAKNKKRTEAFIVCYLISIILLPLLVTFFVAPPILVLFPIELLVDAIFNISLFSKINGTFILLVLSIFFVPFVGTILLSIDGIRGLCCGSKGCHLAKILFTVLFCSCAFIAAQCIYTLILF